MEVRPSFFTSMLCESPVTPTAVGSHRRVADESLIPVAVALRSIICGDPASESAIVTCPLREPESVGVHTTATAQLASGASVLPATHWAVVVVSAKSGETAILAILTGAVLL